MGCCRIEAVVILSLMLVLPNAEGWGKDGHAIVCKIAQVSLSFICILCSNIPFSVSLKSFFGLKFEFAGSPRHCSCRSCEQIVAQICRK